MRRAAVTWLVGPRVEGPPVAVLAAVGARRGAFRVRGWITAVARAAIAAMVRAYGGADGAGVAEVACRAIYEPGVAKASTGAYR